MQNDCRRSIYLCSLGLYSRMCFGTAAEQADISAVNYRQMGNQLAGTGDIGVCDGTALLRVGSGCSDTPGQADWENADCRRSEADNVKQSDKLITK